MASFAGHLRGLNERYLGPEGERHAREELVPVVQKFLPRGGRVLEVGCGFGRNLAGLATISGAVITGCDVSEEELHKARERVRALSTEEQKRITLVAQAPDHLPFPDGLFDMVILWQVLEHVFGRTEKEKLLHECARVVMGGGYILIETPNFWFPLDYHDSGFPFVHWILPDAVRGWLTAKVRRQYYHPSEYGSLPEYTRTLRRAPGVTRVTKVTRVYFAGSYVEAWRNLAGTQIVLKRLLFVLYAPLHFVLSLFGSSADLFLPSLRVVWRIEKK